MFKKIRLKFNSFFSEGHNRTLLAKKNIASSFLIKGGSIIVGLLLVPMTINYVNPTQYGIWLTLSSIISWFSFFDIGLGNGLKNKLAETNALGNSNEGKVYVSTTYAILTIISFLVFLLFLCINPFINWTEVLNAPKYKGDSLSVVALVIVGFFCLSFVFQIINTILTASHKPAIASLIGFVGSFFSLIVIFILTKYTDSSLVNLVLVLAGIPLLVQIFYTIFLFRTSFNELSPEYKSINFKYAKELLSVGGKFFLIQIGVLLLFQTDNIIIIQLFGPEEVTIFNIAYKLFFVVIMINTIVISPFWSAFTEAYVKNDLVWIKSTFDKLKKYSFFLSFATVILFLISPVIFKIWLGGSVEIPFSVSFSMSLYVIGYCWIVIYSHILNGIGKIKIQLYLYIGTTIFNIPLAIILGKNFGIEGVIFSNVLCFVFIGSMLSVQCNKILNKTASGIWDK